VFVSKFFQTTHTREQVFHAWKCFSIGVMPWLSGEKKFKVNRMRCNWVCGDLEVNSPFFIFKI
jgi:hypothetical protein